MFITLNQITIKTPLGWELASDVTMSFGKERTGIVGRNGCGKSTLLHVIAGHITPVSGMVTAAGSIGMLRQNLPSDWSVAKALGIEDEHALLSRILAGEGTEADLANADWDLNARTDAALTACGFGPDVLGRRAGSFSGGERTRIGIVRLIIANPDFVLLDEPTNNLDQSGRAMVSQFARDWRGGVIIASHDRALLEEMDSIAEISAAGVRSFGGGWTAFETARNEQRERIVKEASKANAGLKLAKRDAQIRAEAQAKRDKAGRASAAAGSDPKLLLNKRAEKAENTGGRGKALADKAVADAEAARAAARAQIEIITPVTIDLPPCGLVPGTPLLELEDVTANRGTRVLGPWSMRIDGAERVQLQGANGSGKTALLRIAAGLDMETSGRVKRAQGRIAMLDQHIDLLAGDKSVLDNVRSRHPELSSEAAHAVCARFAFRNVDAARLAGTLSGGERVRAGLAAAFSGPSTPWLLILDEPTNHLDIGALEVLEQALNDFDGALLVVSHDVSFVERVGFHRVVAL